MNSVNVTELRQHLPEYLKQVQQGEEEVDDFFIKAIKLQNQWSLIPLILISVVLYGLLLLNI